MKVYVINLNIWIFGEIEVEMKFGQKTACQDMATFLPNLGKKITDFEIWKRFGGSLKDPNIW
jgi:hypothetical protein